MAAVVKTARWIVLLVAVAASASCQTTTRDALGRDRTEASKPKRVAPPPPNTRPQQMMLVAGVPGDADANGFPDTIPVVVYLFAAVDVYPLPLIEPGEFEFQVVGRDGVTLGDWVFDREGTSAAAQNLPPGRGFVFGLRLRSGVDRMENQPVALTATFTAARDGRQISSSGSATVRLGAGVRAPEPLGR